jgi:hypothetical protein
MEKKPSLVFLFLILLTVPFSLILNGWVLSTLWGWFVTPLGAPIISLPNAIGLSLIVFYLFPKNKEQEDESESSERRLVKSVFKAFGVPIFACVFGWIVHQFM